ncbi:MAG: DUF4884 domain-containing protein [Bacteroidota bacterium]|nr:DUF4884 domain-containing protein [Bacteroidota bacterium]
MKALIKWSILILVIINISSCIIQKPISIMPPNNNKTYEVEYLFEHDGCKVYRFRDYGHYVYFTNCKSNVTSIENDSIQIRVTNSVKNTVKNL